MRRAAVEISRSGGVPYAGHCSDPCDGRSQGSLGMYDRLAYRNDAASSSGGSPARFRQREACSAATCDKGLPAMMMALASLQRMPTVLLRPAASTLAPSAGEDAGKMEPSGVRDVRGEISLEAAAKMGCRACASPGGGCQFLGTAATAQVVGEASELRCRTRPGTLRTADLARYRAADGTGAAGHGTTRHTVADILTEASIKNAMVVFAAFGGSTNLILTHTPAIAHSGGVAAADSGRLDRREPSRAADGGGVAQRARRPSNGPGVSGRRRAGGHAAAPGSGDAGTDAMTVSGLTGGETLAWWENSPRRAALRALLRERDGVDPDEVILTPDRAVELGMSSTVCFPRGNLAPEGSVIKSTAIDPRVIDADGVYRKTGPARVFTHKRDAIAAVKGQGPRSIEERGGEVIVLIRRGPAAARGWKRRFSSPPRFAISHGDTRWRW